MHHIWKLWSFDDCLPSFCVLWPVAILFGYHGKISKEEIREAPAGKEDPFTHQEEMKNLLLASGKRRLWCTLAGKENPIEFVSCLY